MRNKTPELNIHFQWLFYCKKVGLVEEDLPEVQRAETKRAFYAGAGLLLLAFRDKLSANEDEAVLEMENMYAQARAFFDEEVAEGR